MIYLDSLVDNTDSSIEEVFKKVVPRCEEVRVATGYFYLSGFNLIKDDLENLLAPDELEHAPFRILMGRQTDRATAEEIEAGKNLRKQFHEKIEKDIEGLNNAQLERLEHLRDFIAQGLVEVRVRIPEDGYFHAKGACFRGVTEEDDAREGETDRRPVATIVGSSNFSFSGQRNNIELNLTSQDGGDAEAFEQWYDNQWANSEEFSEEIVEIIENSSQFQDWQDQQEQGGTSESEGGDGANLGTYLEPFELYRLLAYDALGGNVSTRDSPLYYFQTLGYESAKEKLSQYNGCIISDSVGPGKSYIGSKLLYDYRQRGDRCLLIVPAYLCDQWTSLLESESDENGNPLFGLEVDGTHLEVMSISRFQNLRYDEVQEFREQFDVILIDEAHRFRNHGNWRPNPDHEDDYKGTRRHANLRQLRGKTMIMLTVALNNNSANDLKNLISLFSGEDELRTKAGLDFGVFGEYIDLAADRKRVAAGEQEMSDTERERVSEKLHQKSKEVSNILNEVMVLRTRKRVKDQIQEGEGLEMSFEPPTIHKQEYSLPPAYQPIYQMLPEVMDALHLPHITVRNPHAGGTLKALYKLNLLKRLESSTHAFVQSLEMLHESERTLLRLLEGLPEDEDIETLRELQTDQGDDRSLDDFVEGAGAVEDLEQTLEEFGFDLTAVRFDGGDDERELADATVGEVIQYVREDLTLLAYFLTQFIGDVALDGDDVNDNAVEVRTWLQEHKAGVLPSIPEDERNPLLYPESDLKEADSATRDFYKLVFNLREFRDPKIVQLGEVLQSNDEKVIVFTQYRATADYVYRMLRDDPDTPLSEGNSAVVKGGDENKQEIIRRFAPEATGYQQTLSESGESELKYVIATDTLSEGVNLQDVHTVVNYDLPWNPMRIVQRVGRIDRIGSTAEKHVHNFYPDGDIETAIRLLERLQAKINDIAFIVGKENNILDPNEDQVLERAAVETHKTIGELEIEEIESSLRETRAVDDYNELDDTSKNPLFHNVGCNEEAALERYLLKQELNEELDLDLDDFGFAQEYFTTPPEERDILYTNVSDHDSGPRPGVFGLAHLWFENDNDAPLGRVRRAFYYKAYGEEVKQRPVRMLQFTPETDGTPISGATSRVLQDWEAIDEIVDDRLVEIREGQTEGAFEQGAGRSKEQEVIDEETKVHARLVCWGVVEN